ncbi:hypothetical protein [Nocardia carnea]|uniref:hypothetical protein n=1 Tax=Nocardia carnea TaxID=37328 RepID=UPI002457C78F|nr:hypothetical protein [Nocardia carnea]
MYSDSRDSAGRSDEPAQDHIEVVVPDAPPELNPPAAEALRRLILAHARRHENESVEAQESEPSPDPSRTRTPSSSGPAPGRNIDHDQEDPPR